MRRRKAPRESRSSDHLVSCSSNSRAAKDRPQRWHDARLFPVLSSKLSNTSITFIIASLCWLMVAQDKLVESQLEFSAGIPKQQPSIVDFSNLAQLLQLRPSWPLASAGFGWSAAADPNNRTSMRFFRNNKTFASIVYTNEQQPSAGIASHQTFNLASSSNNNNKQQQSQSQQQQQQNNLNRLINCHLVDLEKHSTDVALFESKYNIRTVDIEFADMMQLIEACTEIARLRMPPINRLVASVGSGNGNGNGNGTGANWPLVNAATNVAQPQAAMMKPLLVVGRPVPASPPVGGAMTTKSSAAAAISSARSANELSLSILSASEESAGAGLRTRRKVAPQAGNHLTDPASKHQHQQQHQQEDQHRLTLGEVTPPASLVASTKLREAIQEITSYDTSDLMSIWRGILPGTNWCGMGDRATSYNDLGFESDIDICCRAHDFCPIRLSAFSYGYGLFNWSFYTRSHCRCDRNFLDCLRKAESPLASVVMKFYFAIMRTTCLHDNQTSLLSPSDADGGIFGLGGGGGGTGRVSVRQHSHGIRLRAGDKLMADKLFERLKAKLPIPRAVEGSQVLLSKVDTKQAQMQRYAGSNRSAVSPVN